jgi:hypothetical protein
VHFIHARYPKCFGDRLEYVPVIDTAVLIFDIAHIYSNAGQAIRLLLGFTR